MPFLENWLANSQRRGKNGEKKGRGPARSGTEKLNAEMAFYLRGLRRKGSPKYDRLMETLVNRQYDIQQEGEIEKLVNTISLLQKGGVLKGLKGLGNEDEWWKDLLKELAGSFGPAIAMQQQAQMVPAQMPQPEAQPQPQSTPSPAPAGQGEQEVYMSLASRYVVSQLDGKTPEEAAKWLLRQKFPGVKEFVAELVAVPDEELGPFLASKAQTVPELGGAVVWLLKRPDWTRLFAQNVRQMAAARNEASGGAA